MKENGRIWQEVLETIYDNGGSVTKTTINSDTGEFESNSQIHEELENYSSEEIQTSIELLIQSELIKIERDDPDNVVYQMSPTGFQVAHEKEMQASRQETNDDLATFTLMLVMVGVLQVAAAALQVEKLGNQMILLFGALAIAISVSVLQSGFPSRVKEMILNFYQ